MWHHAELPITEHGWDHNLNDVRSGLSECAAELSEQCLG